MFRVTPKERAHVHKFTIFSVLVLLLLGSCGGGAVVIDDTQNDQSNENGEGQGNEGGSESGGAMREGPEGCYIVMEMRCDCDLTEASCSEEGAQVWTDGCSSCAE